MSEVPARKVVVFLRAIEIERTRKRNRKPGLRRAITLWWSRLLAIFKQKGKRT